MLVSSGTVLTVKVPEAQKAMADMRAGLKETLEDAAGGVTVRSINTVSLPGQSFGDESLASRTTMQVSAPGERVTMNADFVFFRSGRTVSGVFAFQVGSPFPDAERNRLAALLESRATGKPVFQAKSTADEAPATTVPEAPATTTASSGRSTWTRYSDPSGVQLEHAPAWTVRPGAAGPLAVLMDPANGVPFRRNVTISLQATSVPITLDDLTDLNVEELEGLDGYARTTGGPTTLSGIPAHRLSYRATVDGEELRFLSVWTVRNSKVWTVTYTSDPARFTAGMGDVERLLTSVRLPSAA